MKILPIVLAAAAAPWLSGCIAWEIRDGIRETNQHLSDVKPTLVHTLNSVDQTNREIDATQAQLTEVQAAIAATNAQISAMHALLGETKAQLVTVEGTLVQTNPKLNDLDGGLTRMKILDEVHASLKQVNAALGPLSSAMGSLGGTMSFLGMGGDSSPDLLAHEQPAPAPDAEPAEPSAAAAPAAGATSEDASKRPDPLLGTWVLVYPPPAPAPGGAPAAATHGASRITVFTADGRFIVADDGRPPQGGIWKREGRTLTMTLDPAPGDTSPRVESGELLTLSTRTLTIRRGDVIRVHARP